MDLHVWTCSIMNLVLIEISPCTHDRLIVEFSRLMKWNNYLMDIAPLNSPLQEMQRTWEGLPSWVAAEVTQVQLSWSCNPLPDSSAPLPSDTHPSPTLAKHDDAEPVPFVPASVAAPVAAPASRTGCSPAQGTLSTAVAPEGPGIVWWADAGTGCPARWRCLRGLFRKAFRLAPEEALRGAPESDVRRRSLGRIRARRCRPSFLRV